MQKEILAVTPILYHPEMGMRIHGRALPVPKRQDPGFDVSHPPTLSLVRLSGWIPIGIQVPSQKVETIYVGAIGPSGGSGSLGHNQGCHSVLDALKPLQPSTCRRSGFFGHSVWVRPPTQP